MVSAKRRRAGKKAGRASRHCKGKKGRSFQACRRAYYRTHK